MRILALVQAQAWELRRNPTLMMIPIIVLVISVMYAIIGQKASSGEDFSFMQTASVILTIYLVGSQFPAMSLAEEREKRTMEALLLTPVRPVDVIAARSLLTAALCLVTGVVAIAMYQKLPANLLLILLGYALGLTTAIAVGTTIGLLAPDQKTAGIAGSPVFMFLTFSTIMPWQIFAPKYWELMKWFPTRPLFEIVNAGLYGGTEIPLLQDVAVMLVYSLAAFFLCARVMRRVATAK